MTESFDPQRYAADWIAAWNRRDIEAVLSHFRDDATFESPNAEAVVGTGRIVGKEALRAYWERGLSRIESLEFTPRDICHDPAGRSVAVHYIRAVDGSRKSVCETMWFDDAGMVIRARVYHGAAH